MIRAWGESVSGAPAVSCICITQNRRFFLRRAIAYFWRAARFFEFRTGDLEGLELVILDGSARSNVSLIETALSVSGERIGRFLEPYVRYYHYPSEEHSRTGWFHNEAVRLARGQVIIQWDDDDWHDTYRIQKQWETLRNQIAPSITFTSQFFWYHLLEKKACLSRSWYGGGSAVGAMLAYHRETWEKAPFRDVAQGEDNFFFDDHRALKTPMIDVKDPSFCIYVRHSRNGSPLVNAEYAEEHTERARFFLECADDLDFYDELSELLPLDSWNRPPRVVNPYAQHALLLRRR